MPWIEPDYDRRLGRLAIVPTPIARKPSLKQIKKRRFPRTPRSVKGDDYRRQVFGSEYVTRNHVYEPTSRKVVFIRSIYRFVRTQRAVRNPFFTRGLFLTRHVLDSFFGCLERTRQNPGRSLPSKKRRHGLLRLLLRPTRHTLPCYASASQGHKRPPAVFPQSFHGAGSGSRTRTPFRAGDFKSPVSANSTIPANQNRRALLGRRFAL